MPQGSEWIQQLKTGADAAGEQGEGGMDAPQYGTMATRGVGGCGCTMGMIRDRPDAANAAAVW